ncbi:MAG: hypothetical protein LBI19_04265 [Oscillospiraceae bacterium]|jgi:hypothetical protein|nr:hypothetical protein [Oscillospiraceae bacterium]
MLTKETFRKAALRLYDDCEYPAVRYNILFRLLDTPYEDQTLCELRPAFLSGDIVEELHAEQDYFGGWGPLQSKDYSQKAKFPTSMTAINRCLYIGLTIEDRDILLRAYEYLEDFLKGTSRERLYNKNERAIPWQTASICETIEAIKPYNELCDRTFGEWLYIASRAYEDGMYSYERERKAQHEIFYTREDRLIPMQFGLLLKRREELSPDLEEMMLRHHGGHAARHGWFWDKTPDKLPENFVHNKSRRWFHTFNYINQFHGSALYLADAVNWLIEQQNADGLWDWGPQVKDPWGYFGTFSTSRNTKHNRMVDCTMEVLDFLKTYMDHNES